MLRISETATRATLINPLLTKAGWNLKDRTQVDIEIPVDGYDKEPLNGITDYCLFHPSGEVLAIVEAKKTSRHARARWPRAVANLSGQGRRTRGANVCAVRIHDERPRRFLLGFWNRKQATHCRRYSNEKSGSLVRFLRTK
jgi:hypothetical protein